MRVSIGRFSSPPPVGARDGAELEGIRPDLAGGGYMGAAAKVHEAILLIERDGSFLKPVDELELEGLVREDLPRLLLGHLATQELRRLRR